MFKTYLTLINLLYCLILCGYNSYLINELSNLKILNGGAVTWSINENCIGYPNSTNQNNNGRDTLAAMERLFLNTTNSKTIYGCFSPFRFQKSTEFNKDSVIPFIPYLFLTINIILIWKGNS
jgi:hypothetical protein